MAQAAPKFPDRIRFNWGYHDGTADAQDARKPLWQSPHFDKQYEAGYAYGRADFEALKRRPESSNIAWQVYQTAVRNGHHD